MSSCKINVRELASVMVPYPLHIKCIHVAIVIDLLVTHLKVTQLFL